MTIMNSYQLIATMALLSFASLSWAGGGVYPKFPEENSKWERAQVLAELREAQRLGVMPGVGESELPAISAKDEKLIADAGRRAVEPTHIASDESKTK